ncbi:hypothetical protein ACIBKZ_26950 [Streptomyces sp. NPDC050421]|uniref:hypothetical protein n=1 Tax=unclassified Streptomyces TaxID=2593676 RepID=UPI00379B41C4
MSSKLQEPVSPQVRVRDRFGVVLTASMLVLFVEAAIGVIAFFVWGQTQESPGRPYSAMGLFVLILGAAVMAVVGAVLAVLLSVGVVMPLLVVAGWLGRRFAGREAWWWVPVLAAVGSAPAAAVLVEAGVLAGLGGWLAVTGGLTVTALVARRPLLPDRRWLSGGALFGRVVLYGTLAVVTAATVAGIALFAGIGYEPPQLGVEGVAGTWSDGKGGTLVLTVGGEATATRVEMFGYGYSSGPETHECTGTGGWGYDPGAGSWSQKVEVYVDDCPMDAWEVFGTSEHPKLFVYIGDPDSWDLYILERRDHA